MTIDGLIADLERTVPRALEEHGVPGAAVGICDEREILWSAGFGSTAHGGGTPVTAATRFSVQSTSKLFTATCVLLAVQRSLVDLDEPITTYLPEFTVHSLFEDEPAGRMTLRHLLSHTAGFTHEAPLGSNHSIGDGDFADHCASIADTWLRFPVGHHHEYSNLGIDLAGYIIQRVSGVPFEEWARRELFEPLGLARTTFDAGVIAADPERAVGHWRPFTEAGRPLPVRVPMVAAGGLYTSVEDALRYVRFHLRSGGKVLAEALLREHYRIPFPAPGQSLGYGLGLYLDEWEPGVRVRHHGGSGFGFQAQLCWLPEAGYGVVMLTNRFDHSVHDDTVRGAVARLAGTPSPPAEEPAGTPRGDAHGLDVLAGEYVGRLEDRVLVRVRDGRLFVDDEDGGHEAVPTGPATMAGRAGRCSRFLPGRYGPAGYLQDLRDGTVRYRNDAPESALDPTYDGTYVLRAWGLPVGEMRIFQDGRSPAIQRLGDEEKEDGAAIRLAPISPGRYLSATGEILDLTGPDPVYANVPLDRTGGER
ncbi:serine hydrolase domain-containing protein [Actinomadura sp. DC4]|uniref:serine hydrolase domain-containing protein n=1 Tax=Actinomadura sp. DC4 TaxID=3055069 RepID=UPI0025B00900|nr:serine hydrolase domain-containing protein [Actinomadura sp. DC4]MDN3353651.1 serine hydrolase domain-containing protein [Actinomadura sp. DC4]